MKGNETEQKNIETKQINWEDLSISNDFLFGKVMEYPERQKTMKEDFDAKGVRLDV